MEERWRAESSPVFRAIWGQDVDLDAFDSTAADMPAPVRAVMDGSVAIVRRRKKDGTLYGPDAAIAPEVVAELAQAGFWGLRASTAFGGSGAGLRTVAQCITEMMVADPWMAGLLSCHECLGPVASLEAFGSAEQKERLLPPLVSGQRLGAFAVTEPGASSDWTAIRTVARRDGDRLLVSGEKLFTTNGGLGRTVNTMCLIDGQHQMVLIELPTTDGEQFRTVNYRLKAPAHLKNVGLVFDGLSVPAANVLQAPRGDGRVIAYHALNNGRVGVCAMCAGALRLIAGSVLPWVQQRRTFGAAIGSRELVQRRLGWLAGRIVACDAMVAWAGQLLDEGYRGELEGVTAKVFGSESLKEATVDVLLKTHGGRALLEGNLFADTVCDLLAPTVYEGENEILTLGYFHSVARAHSQHYLAPIAAAMKKKGEGAAAKRPGVSDLLSAGRHAASYSAWLVQHEARQAFSHKHRHLKAAPGDLAEVALELLGAMALEISAALRHFGSDLVHRHALTFDLARRAQLATAMLVVSRYAERQQDPVVRQAAICAALELGTRLTNSRPGGELYHLLTELGQAVAEDRFAPVASADRGAVAMAESLLAI